MSSYAVGLAHSHRSVAAATAKRRMNTSADERHRRFFGWFARRGEPTTYQKFLAVHMYYATSPKGHLL